MIKLRIFCLFAIGIILFNGCQKDSNFMLIRENQSFAISMEVPCQNSEGQLSSKAVVIISGDDFDSIVQFLTVEACRVTGTVNNIPAGHNRQITIDIFDINDKLIFTGSATADITIGSTSTVQIKLRRATGSINVIATMCDSIEPFKADENTLALYHFDELDGDVLFDETQKWPGKNHGACRVKGKWGKALLFSNNSYAGFDTIIPNGLTAGTVEFYTSFDSTMNPLGQYAIFGNDGSRILFVYDKGKLFFLKNHSDVFKFISTDFQISLNNWYHIAASWGPKGMRLFINGALVASNDDKSAYESSPRLSEENVFYVGKKSWCCMNGIGIGTSLSFSGKIDEIRISSIERY